MSLIGQIAEYRKNEFNQFKEHYRNLENGQAPHTLLITCSDSRLMPEEFSRAKAGELFVIRNAGNLVPAYNEATPTNEGVTLEYGVTALGVKNIVVCGHASCGAMKGLLALEELDSVPIVQKALTNYRRDHEDEIARCETLDETIAWNVRVQLKALLTYPFISKGLKNGTLDLYGMVYDFVGANVSGQYKVTAQGEVVDEVE